MHQPTIYIPVESKKREFDGKILLSARLLEHGFRVVLGTKSGIHREILQARHGIYLAKSASNVFLSFYRQLKNRGHHLVVLDVEGGALTREIKNDLLRSYQPEASAYFDFFYVFGEKIRDAILRELDYIKPDMVVVTGEPRFDLLRSEYSRFYEEEAKEIQDRYGRYVLFNTSFGLSNSALGDNGILRFLETTDDIPEEQRHLYLLKHAEGKKLIRAFTALAREVASAFPEIQVVIRPHPDEDPALYQRAFQDDPTIHVNGQGNVQPWILCALAVIHHDCTTGMEAVMAGKPTIAYVPFTEETITAWLPVYLSMACASPAEVISSLEPVVNGTQITYHPGEEKAQIFRQYFENYRNHAAGKLAWHLAQHYGTLHSTPLANSLQSRLLRMRSRLNILRFKLGPKKDKWDRFVDISKGEIYSKIQKTGMLNNSGPLSIKAYGGNVARLEIKG